jgi:hypothetical protein
MTPIPHSTRPVPDVVIALILALFVGACAHKNATAPSLPANHNPIISSMWSFPDNIGPQDSMIVVCMGSDPDGDTLVYDWEIDSHFSIKGNATANHHLDDSPYSSQVFYRTGFFLDDTVTWVHCVVRDQRGGGAGRMLTVHLHL